MDESAAVERADAAAPHRPRTWRQLGWFVLIWAARVATLGVVALVIRMLMTLAGMREG